MAEPVEPTAPMLEAALARTQRSPAWGRTRRALTPSAGSRSFGTFATVGVSGLVVNTAALAVCTGALAISPAAGLLVATQVSTTNNFVLCERFVFRGQRHRRSAWVRYAHFSAMNNVGLLLRAPLFALLAGPLGMHLLVANVVSLVILTVARFLVSDRLIWAPSAEPRTPLTVVEPPGTDRAEADGSTPRRQFDLRAASRQAAYLAAIAVPALVLRVAHLDAIGFNSDEVVYAGQAGSIAGDARLQEYFPIFRAHPLLFQTTLSVLYQFGTSELAGRLLAVAFGLATIVVTYRIALRLYGRRTARVAALFLGVMPYHVVVSRQVLLDAPMVLFSTLTLLMLARFADTGRIEALYATSALMGLTVLTNERSLVLIASIYLFLALGAPLRLRLRHIVLSGLVFVLVVTPFPISVMFSGKKSTGSQFLAWQLFRRANHTLSFYAETVPAAIGFLMVGAAAIALWQARKRFTWRETLLVCWAVVPIVYFELWPVKGFQYLLPIAPVVAVLAARAVTSVAAYNLRIGDRRIKGIALALAATILIAGVGVRESWSRISPTGAGDEVLAGSGGVPGGREAGEWIRDNVPEGSTLVTIGPSMANIIEWYGDRTAFGLSVSPNPLHRNPVYEPIVNPDLALRSNDVQYLVWDAYSASRSTFFSEKIQVFAERYHGRVVHREFVPGVDGGPRRPVIVIYEVRP